VTAHPVAPTASVPARVEHLLSARLFLAPQIAGDRLFFISDLSGRLSLYAMDAGGSVPEPLLPPDIALLTPELINGEAFIVLPDLGEVLLVVDRDGDENMQLCRIPLDGGDPEPVFGDRFADQQMVLAELSPEGIGTIWVDPRRRPEQEAYEIDVTTATTTMLAKSKYGTFPTGHDQDRSRYLLVDGYTTGDDTLWIWERQHGERRLLHGIPLEDRSEGDPVRLTGFNMGWFVDESTVVVETSLFDDLGGLGRLSLDAPDVIEPVEVMGKVHTGDGEWEQADRADDGRFTVNYNVDGVSWGYEGTLNSTTTVLELRRVLWGNPPLAAGVIGHRHRDEATDRIAVSFSSATTPAQLAVIDHDGTSIVTRNRILGVDPALFAPGEDTSYNSHDGLRVSARLYLPAEPLGYQGPRPVIHYVHGGPQGQERPDFTWFSMPLIQYLTLNGFAVFVPNVRGSTGYGMDYVKHVDRDWGGMDRLDHVAGVEHLGSDPRLDVSRIGVTGRSYGGYMTLMLAGLHPEIWSAACDMFGPFDLLTWIEGLPEAWQVYFHQVLGDPATERDELEARSPRTHLGSLSCPLLVIQGGNDPRVMQSESDKLVAELRAAGKDVDYLVFEDEGHDLTRLVNKVKGYQAITDFFATHLRP
jgi:dienelactone hydrolase